MGDHPKSWEQMWDGHSSWPPRTWGIAVYPLGVLSDELCSFIDELKLSSLDHQATLLNDQKKVGLLSSNQFLVHFFFQQSSLFQTTN